MEDPGEEYWEIEDYSQPYESDGKLGWIWRKGLSVGKKIVVTGVVITSAPFVLPPLVALSAIGIACSVPAGFVFVTYACTDKLMDTLLPMPSPPPWPEKGTESFDEEEYKVYADDVYKGYGEYDDIEAEEKEYEEDMRRGVETRIELAEESYDNRIDYGVVPIRVDALRYKRKGSNEIVEEGYEENFDEVLENERADTIAEILEGIREAEDEISLMEGGEHEMPKGSLQTVVVEAKVDGENEDNVEQVLENLSFVGAPETKDEKGHTEGFTDINEEEMRRETTGLVEEMRDGSKEPKMRKNEGKEETPVKDDQDKRNRNLSAIPEEVKPDDNNRGVISGTRNGEISKNASGVGNGEIKKKVSERKPQVDESVIPQAEPKPVVEERLVVHVKTSDDRTTTTTTDVRQETVSDRKKTGTLVLSDADAREMADESGFDFLEQGTLAAGQIADSDKKSSKGKPLSSKNMVDVNVHKQEFPIESTAPLSKSADTASDRDITTGPNKVSANEEKIREQIQAMRTVVGYRDAPHSSCSEELKALYVFTGVEPPASSKDSVDLADIDERLHFLMSVIGVK